MVVSVDHILMQLLKSLKQLVAVYVHVHPSLQSMGCPDFATREVSASP